MKRTARIFAWILTVSLLVAAACTAYAAAPEEVKLEVTFGQTEARSMLSMINAFRASGAECWNSDNETTTEYPALAGLAYDYELEKTAMQRAAELAVLYSHTRPDSTSCGTAFPESEDTGNTLYAWGENIAAGQGAYDTAYEVYMGWREDDEDYAGQGHRRNMLGDFNCIGIGHAIYDGKHFWAQSLGYRDNPVKSETTPCDTAKTVTVRVNPDIVTEVTSGAGPLSIMVGETSAVPGIDFYTSKKWPNEEALPYVPADGPAWWTADAGKLSVGETTMTAKNVGKVTITASALGKDFSSEVTVTRKIADCILEISTDSLVYTGKAQTPAVTLKDGETKLTEGTDYTLEYKDNVNATDKAKVVVTGKGFYTGTSEGTFTIGKASLTVTAKDKTITYGDAPAGGGFTCSGFVNGETESVLGGTVAYSFSYKQYGDAGDKYTITPSGLTSGNYQITWKDGKLTVSPKEVGLSWGKTKLPYNGKAQAPEAKVTGTVNSDALTASVTGAQTKIGGGYTAKVTGLSGAKAGNYKLPTTVTAAFEIVNPYPEVTAPKAKNGLVGTGALQELVTAGSAVGGTMVYSLTEGGGYTAALPAVVDPGTYVVWYKALGDSEHVDTEPESLTVTVKSSGITETGGVRYLYADGKIRTNYSALYNDPDLGWLLIRGGAVDSTYTGLWNDPAYGWQLVTDGVPALNYSGLWDDPDYGCRLIREGAVVFDYNGLYRHTDGSLFLLNGGAVDWNYTGLYCDAKEGWMLIGNGMAATWYNGLWNDPNYGWWLVQDGAVAFSYNGLWGDTNCGWWLVQGGQIAFDYTGLYYDANVGWWLIGNGTIVWDYTGLWCDPVYGWWLVGSGHLCDDYNGLWCDPQFGWWLVQDGAVAFGYNGLWEDPNLGWWLVQGGQIAFDYTGLYYDVNVGWWLIGNGTIAWGYTGLWCDPVYGWWLVGGGHLCSDYNGLWEDPQYGWWLIRNGTIAFDYTGPVEEFGAVWNIVNGQLN